MLNQRPLTPGWPNQQPKPLLVQQTARSIDHVQSQILKLTKSGPEREEALYFLSQQREIIPDLAVMLWESPATVTALLYEVLSIYPYVTTSGSSAITPSSRIPSRVCHALTLFQSIASHEETRIPFLRANFPDRKSVV